MFVNRMLNQDATPALEQLIRFTGKRQRLLAENIANVDVPNYRQKDLSVRRFEQMLGKALEDRGRPGGTEAKFADLSLEIENPTRGILSHDGNNRSMEELMTDEAKNGMMHNLAIELLRKQFQQLDMALKERVA